MKKCKHPWAEVHMEQNESSWLISPVDSQPATTCHEQETILDDLVSKPTEYNVEHHLVNPENCEKIIHCSCFKLLSFGVVCYTELDNQSTCLK